MDFAMRLFSSTTFIFIIVTTKAKLKNKEEKPFKKEISEYYIS